MESIWNIYLSPPPNEVVTKIVHRIPKYAFSLNGTVYDPKDIIRFNGKKLHMIVGSQVAAEGHLLAFTDKIILTNWLEMILLSKYVSANAFLAMPDISASPKRIQDYNCPPGQTCGVTYCRPVIGMPKHVWLFEDINKTGLVLGLDEEVQIQDLSNRNRRTTFFSNESWNDAVSSILNNASLCAFFENPDFQGSVRLLVPGVSVNDLDYLGFNDCISSAINFG